MNKHEPALLDKGLHARLLAMVKVMKDEFLDLITYRGGRLGEVEPFIKVVFYLEGIVVENLCPRIFYQRLQAIRRECPGVGRIA